MTPFDKENLMWIVLDEYSQCHHDCFDSCSACILSTGNTKHKGNRRLKKQTAAKMCLELYNNEEELFEVLL